MILSSKKILEQFRTGNWIINKNVEDIKYGPNSIDVTLSNVFLEQLSSGKPLDPEKDSPSYTKHIIHNCFDVCPNMSLLGSVNEVIDCSNPVVIEGKEYLFIPMYEGRSTFARLFLLSHISAGFGDYGFKGSFTLELKNLGVDIIRLKPGMRVGQVYFESTDSGVLDNPYVGYDQTDGKPQMPRLGEGRF